MTRSGDRWGRWAGPAVLAITLAMFLIAATTGYLARDRAERPYLTDLPMPAGATIRAQVEQCQDGDGGTRRCTAILAVGPVAGIELPRPAEELLIEHLRANGWRPVGAGRLRAREGADTATVRAFEAVRRTDPGLADTLTGELEEYVDAEQLAVIALEPGTADG